MDANLTEADFEVVKALRGVRNLKDALHTSYQTGFRTPDGSPLGLFRARLSADLRKAQEHLQATVTKAVGS